MFWTIKNIIRMQKFLNRYQFLDKNRLEWLLNYMENLQGGGLSYNQQLPVDCLGKPIPWITYPAIEFINQFNLSECKIFEYGSGNSSKFWAKRCQQIVSVESDKKWFEQGKTALLPNQELLYQPDKDLYAQSIAKQGNQYDVVVIDGMYRLTCARMAINYLSKTGMIVFDNSDWCPQSVLFLRSQNMIQIDFAGIGPSNNYAWCTTFFLRREFDIPRQYSNGHIQVIGSISQNDDDRPIRS